MMVLEASSYPDGKPREEYLLFVEEPCEFRSSLVPSFEKLLPTMHEEH